MVAAKQMWCRNLFQTTLPQAHVDLKKENNLFCWPRRHRDCCTSATESHRQKQSHLIRHRSCLHFTSSMAKERDVNSTDVGCTLIQIYLHLKASPHPATCIRDFIDKSWRSGYRKTDIPSYRHCNCRGRWEGQKYPAFSMPRGDTTRKPSPWAACGCRYERTRALRPAAPQQGPLAHHSLFLRFPALLQSPVCLWEAGAAASSWGGTLIQPHWFYCFPTAF